MLNKPIYQVKERSIDITSDSIIASPFDNKSEFNHSDFKFNEFVHKNPFRYSLSITSEKNWINQEKNIQEVKSESSSSVILEDSQDILVLNCKKLHGFHGSFNKKHGINLKKLRKCRYSEHNTNRNLNLQVDDDVQPEIASVKSSFAMSDKRQRARSCYTRISKKLSGEALLKSDESDASILLSELDPIEENHANDPDCSVFIIQPNEPNPFEPEAYYNFEVSNQFPILEKSKTFVWENQDKLIEDLETVKNITCMDEIHPEPAKNKNFSLVSENSSLDINGKVFKYFEKSVLCQISVKTFEEIIKKIEKTKTCKKNYFYFNLKECLRRCFGCQRFKIEEKEFIKKVLEFCQSQFDFSNEVHLSLLLGAYCSVTGEKDWPNSDEEWLNMGFSSTDLNTELQSEGLIGLLYLFFLSVHFPTTLKEMLMVQRYYAYEVFKVCKFFAEDAIGILKYKKLHRFFDGKSKPLDVLFFFCTGMVINWFSYMIKNKDFDETYAKVLTKAKKNPKKFVKIAKKNYSKNSFL